MKVEIDLCKKVSKRIFYPLSKHQMCRKDNYSLSHRPTYNKHFHTSNVFKCLMYLHISHLSLFNTPPSNLSTTTSASAQEFLIIMISKIRFIMGVKVTQSNLSVHCYAWSSTALVSGQPYWLRQKRL